MPSGRVAWVFDKKDADGNVQWPTISGLRDAEVNLHHGDHKPPMPQNQPALYALHPKYEDVGKPPPESFETSADIFSLSVVEKSPRMQASRSVGDLSAQAQKQYRGALTSLGTPDSPTRRHELRRYTQVPWLHASVYPNDRPIHDVVQPVTDAGDDPKNWAVKKAVVGAEAQMYRSGVSPSGRPLHPTTRPDLTQRKSVTYTAQRVKEDGTVIATGFGNRAREMVEDVYGHVRPVWRFQANAMVPDRQTVSPFRATGRSHSPAIKSGKKQPYAFATPPRTGHSAKSTKPNEGESPRFGMKKSPTNKGTVYDRARDSKGVGARRVEELSDAGSEPGINITPIVSPRDPSKQKKKEPLKKGVLGRQETGGYMLSARASGRGGADFSDALSKANFLH
jgi:hypothetical protein